MVRKALGRGLAGEIDADTRRFFALYADNVHRHGTPALSGSYFEMLRREFGADCEVLTVSAPDGRPLSSVMSFYFRDEVLPYYAGDVDFDQIGETGGACTHTQTDHTIGNHGPQTHTVAVGSTAVTVTIGLESLSWTGYTNCATTGITFDDHADHTHYLTYTSQSVTTGQGYTETVDCIDLCTSVQASYGCGSDLVQHGDQILKNTLCAVLAFHLSADNSIPKQTRICCANPHLNFCTADLDADG